MNFKYFLRGLGAGIIFTAIIMLAAYMTNGAYKMSDEEIMKKAEALGMVKAEEAPLVKDTGDETTESTKEPSTEATVSETVSTEELIIDPATDEATEATTEAVTEEATTEAATEVADGQLVKATITVQAGMGSYEVAVLLRDAGIIKDASDFDSYLIRNGYATKIRIKSQEFNSNMTYEEIAKLLVKEN